MMQMERTLTLTRTSDLVLEANRFFPAPRALVWRAMTEPALISQWWGGFGPVTVDQHDLRPGGRWRFVEHGADGTEHAFRGEFLQVQPVTLVEQTFEYEPMAGHIIVERMTLEAVDGGTRLTTRSTYASVEDLEGMVASGMEAGMAASLNKLEALLGALDADAVTLVVTREVRAPVERVWQAWTECEQLARWWGPKGMGLDVLACDVRPGGLFHYAMLSGGQPVMWGRFDYTEVTPMLRLAYLSSFADAEGQVIRTTMVENWPLAVHNEVALEPTAGGTRITLRGIPQDASPTEIAAFAGMHASMQQGFGGTLDQLEEHLAAQ